MNNLFTYLIELNIAITVFYILYLWLFNEDSNFNNRRAFLFFSMGMSFLLPFINIQLSASIVPIKASVIHLEEFIFVAGAKTEAHTQISLIDVLLTIYLLVTIFFFGKMIFGIGKVILSTIRSNKFLLEGLSVRLNSELHASSFFNVIFIDPEKAEGEDLKHILEHESYHAHLIHSADRILAEILMSLSWFNPVSWMLRKSIVVNHEYQADNRVIEHGTDHVRYQLTILNQYIGSASISNQFSNQIKNRIKMLNKNYKKGGFWKSFLLVPISILLLFFMACNNEAGIDEESNNTLKAEQAEKSAEEEIFYVVEEMPQWPGSDDMVLEIRKFIAENLKYPDAAKESGAEGKVFIHFLITNTGDVVIPDPSMLPPEKDNEDGVVVVAYRPLNAEQKLPDDEIIQLFKDESIRVIELLPDMIPGKQRGKAVKVLYTFPITFKLQ